MFWIYTRFWMCQYSEYSMIVNFHGYTGFTCFCKYDRVLNVSGCNYGSVLNITGIQTWQVSAYASFMQGSEYGWIMPE